ncbi:DUF1801 domain-containing protein [Candidatus Saccharibacteria bacterium]|nr:DUF1801 domain-containing protein [Candidatus Saccharibacteria bacterium]
MRNYIAKTVDEYIESSPIDARSKLQEIRQVIKESVPNAEESISWGIPFYKYKGLLAGYSTGKAYVLFGLAFTIDDEVRRLFEQQGYVTGKKTIKIGFDQKVPNALISDMLRTRAITNESK